MKSFIALILLHCAAASQAQVEPPNLVPVTPQLVTSGQPSADWLRKLKSEGYDAVIYLAPPTVPDAVRDEALIVAGQGLVFINLPIAFEQPNAQHLDQFSALMKSLAGRKVLVHCQVNLRASTMVFLHRATALRDDPVAAWALVSRIWVPEGAWRELVRSQLQRHGVTFDPF